MRADETLMFQLEAEPKDTEEWTAKFTVLKENIEHHVEEEDGELFKKARQATVAVQKSLWKICDQTLQHTMYTGP